MSQHGWYTAFEAAALLGFKRSRDLGEFAKNGFLPNNNLKTKGRRYLKGPVDDLARLQTNYLTLRVHDGVLYELYSLRSRFMSVSDVESRREIVRACEMLVESGMARRLRDLAGTLGEPLWRAQDWALTGRLSALKIGSSYYLSTRYAMQVERVWFSWRTVVELAAEHYIPPRKIWDWIHRKGLPAFKFVDGRYRIDPMQFRMFLDSLPKKEEGLLTVSEAVSRIGCDRHTFLARICDGAIETVGRLTELRIPEHEVARWERWFKHLNDEFSWLEPVIVQPGRTVPTIYVRQVVSELGISPPTITAWSQQGLLPFYPDSFAEDGHHTIRKFVRRYIQGLRRYAGGTGKVKKRQAVAYKQLCQEKGNIV